MCESREIREENKLARPAFLCKPTAAPLDAVSNADGMSRFKLYIEAPGSTNTRIEQPHKRYVATAIPNIRRNI